MVTPADPRQLTLVVGDNSGFTLVLYDDRDSSESLAGATRARFTMRSSVNASTDELDLQTGGFGLTIDTSSNEIAAALTTSQADNLTPGVYVASLAVEFGAGNWKHSDRFYVRVLDDVAANLA